MVPSLLGLLVLSFLYNFYIDGNFLVKKTHTSSLSLKEVFVAKKMTRKWPSSQILDTHFDLFKSLMNGVSATAKHFLVHWMVPVSKAQQLSVKIPRKVR